MSWEGHICACDWCVRWVAHKAMHDLLVHMLAGGVTCLEDYEVGLVGLAY